MDPPLASKSRFNMQGPTVASKHVLKADGGGKPPSNALWCPSRRETARKLSNELNQRLLPRCARAQTARKLSNELNQRLPFRGKWLGKTPSNTLVHEHACSSMHYESKEQGGEANARQIPLCTSTHARACITRARSKEEESARAHMHEHAAHERRRETVRELGLSHNCCCLLVM
jgi:hypothetical protein